MPEEIQIKDPDGSESAGTASVGEAEQPSADATMHALSTGAAERLSLDLLEQREAGYGARKPMGPSFTEEPEATVQAVTAEEGVEATEPMELEE